MRILKAAISCLLLILLMTEGEAVYDNGPILPEMPGGRLINYAELKFTENITLQYWYPWNESVQATSKIRLDPSHRYMVMVIELDNS